MAEINEWLFYYQKLDKAKQARIDKFEADVKKRKRWTRFLLAFDQLLNVIWLNGSQDETISSHIGRRMLKGEAGWLEIKLSHILNKFEKNHCLVSLGE